MTGADRRAALLDLAAAADDMPGPELARRVQALSAPDAGDAFARLVDATQIVAGLAAESIDPALVSDRGATVDDAVSEWQARAEDALTCLGCGSAP